jgi:hypothetical protein
VTEDLFLNAEHDDIFKNVLTKKGVEYFYLSNYTNKSIAIFREPIPLIREVHVNCAGRQFNIK